MALYLFSLPPSTFRSLPPMNCTRGLRDATALPLTREAPVPSFRAYPVSNNRKVAAAPSVVIVCENDADGLRQARQLVSDDDIELWDGPRFIARLKSLHGSKEPH
jgi:hypothetical protein